VRRFLLTILVVAAVVGGLYWYAASRQEARYLTLIEEGDAALARDDSFAAIEAFTVAIAIRQDSMAGHLKRGEAYRRRGELEAALRDVRSAADIDPLAPQPRELLGDINAAMGDHARAIDRYREYLALDDRAPRVLYKLAVSELATGQSSAAADSLRNALTLDERFAEAHYLLGACLNDLQRPAQAVAPLVRAVALNPGLVPAHEELVLVYGRLNRREEQNRQLEVLAGLDRRPSREVALAESYAVDGRDDRALRRLRTAAAAFPDDARVNATLGRLWLERSEQSGGAAELKEAVAALRVATEQDPTSEALMLYGRALAATGQLAAAESALLRATTRFPVDPASFFHLAEVAERRGQTRVADKALIDYARLVSVNSPRHDAETLARIAEAYWKNGNLPAARQAVELALRKDPSSAHARAMQEKTK
jgi:tetratricopeptide (TPR) repeat protein